MGPLHTGTTAGGRCLLPLLLAGQVHGLTVAWASKLPLQLTGERDSVNVVLLRWVFHLGD